MTTDLTDFLLARIAEDEARATAAPVGSGREWFAPPEWAEVERPSRSQAAHIVAWDPTRVLTECDAKRRIVDWHRLVDGLDDDDKPVRGCPNCIASGAVAPYLIAGPCLTVRLLALPYADHPDYREEWKP